MNEQEEAGIRQTTLDLKRLSVESSPVYRTILRMFKKKFKKKKQLFHAALVVSYLN